MANNTDFLNLIKPEEGDFADINQLNKNFDKLDDFAKEQKRDRQQLHDELLDEIEKKVDMVPGKGLSSNDFTDELRTDVLNARERAGIIDFPFELKPEAFIVKNYAFLKEQVEKNIPNIQFVEKYCKTDRLFRMKNSASLKWFKNTVVEWTGEIFQVVGNDVVENLIVTSMGNDNEQTLTTPSSLYDPKTSELGIVYCSCRTKTDYTGYKRAYVIITDESNNRYVHATDSDFPPGSYMAFSFIVEKEKKYKVQFSKNSINEVSMRRDDIMLIPQI